MRYDIRMERILSNQAPSHEGQRIKIAGWVAARRDHACVFGRERQNRDRAGGMYAKT